jgi:hypothetical protein
MEKEKGIVLKIIGEQEIPPCIRDKFKDSGYFAANYLNHPISGKIHSTPIISQTDLIKNYLN